MRAHVWGLIGLAALTACGPRSEERPRTLLEQGRQYTSWLYDNQYQKLWDRFSPDMRQTFGSVADLASFAGRAVSRLGPEKRALDEIQKLTDDEIKKMEEMSKGKEKEVMEIK
jgi:hypothetical protein